MPNEDQAPAPSNMSKGTGSTDTEVPGAVDWWNITSGEDKVDSTSFPLDVWSPLLPHDTGCTSSLSCTEG